MIVILNFYSFISDVQRMELALTVQDSSLVSSHSGLHLGYVNIMECLRAEFWLSVIHIHVNANASEQSHHCFFKKCEEQWGGDESHSADNNDWSPNRNFLGFRRVLHDHIEREAVSGHNTDLTQENECLCNHISEGELQTMLQVQEESVPGGKEERLTCHGHVAEGSLV